MNSTKVLNLVKANMQIHRVESTRAMATLRETQQRLKSVSNIAKITKSMKMIASTKLAKAQRAMNNGKHYGKVSQSILESVEVKLPDNAVKLYIVASSDKGLCGGIHSSVSKATKKVLVDNPEAKVIVLGDKAKAQLSRGFKNNIAYNYNQIGKAVPTYSEAAAVARSILDSEIKFDGVEIIYNVFKSVIAYEPGTIKAYSKDLLENSGAFEPFELDDQAVFENYQEFMFTNAVYWALVEGHASEMAAKRTAMENATKNAGL